MAPANDRYVRVKDSETGHHLTVATTAVRGHHKRLDEPAVDVNGRPLPAKPNLNPSPKTPPKGGNRSPEGQTTNG